MLFTLREAKFRDRKKKKNLREVLLSHSWIKRKLLWYKFRLDKILASKMGCRSTVPTVTKKLFAIDICWGKENQFLTLLQTCPYPTLISFVSLFVCFWDPLSLSSIVYDSLALDHLSVPCRILNGYISKIASTLPPEVLQ